MERGGQATAEGPWAFWYITLFNDMIIFLLFLRGFWPNSAITFCWFNSVDGYKGHNGAWLNVSPCFQVMLLLRPFRKYTVCVPNYSFLAQNIRIWQNGSLSSNYQKLVIAAHFCKNIIKKLPDTSWKVPLSFTIVYAFLKLQKI